jgi:hypothetical protein
MGGAELIKCMLVFVTPRWRVQDYKRLLFYRRTDVPGRLRAIG